MSGSDPLISCRAVHRTLGGARRRTDALRGVDLDIAAGESVAVVGRSGSGKSTLVGVLAALDRPQAGSVRVADRDVWALPERERRAVRRSVGWIPQDALASFDPRYTAGEVVEEAVRGFRTPRRGGLGRARRSGRTEHAELVASLLARVGLDPALAGRRPVTLSGGERQRIAVARALAVEPAVLVADEATSGLDAIARRRVLDVLRAETAGRRRTLVFVTHDLRIARGLADRVVVLENGRIVDDVAASMDDAGPELTRLRRATPGL